MKYIKLNSLSYFTFIKQKLKMKIYFAYSIIIRESFVAGSQKKGIEFEYKDN